MNSEVHAAVPVRRRTSSCSIRARAYTREHGEDLPDVANWTWAGDRPGNASANPGTDNE